MDFPAELRAFTQVTFFRVMSRTRRPEPDQTIEIGSRLVGGWPIGRDLIAPN